MSLPASHANPEAMARCLVTYLSDPRRIRSEILASFGNAPCHSTINALRADWLRRRDERDPHPFKPHEGYYPGDASDALLRANILHVAAILAERRRPRLRVAA